MGIHPLKDERSQPIEYEYDTKPRAIHLVLQIPQKLFGTFPCKEQNADLLGIEETGM